MYPAVEKDASLSWIHVSRYAMPVTLPGWLVKLDASWRRRLVHLSWRPASQRPGVSRQGSASSNDRQPESLRESATYACGAVNRRSVDVGSCARRCFAAATPPHAELEPAEGEGPIKSCGFMPMVG